VVGFKEGQLLRWDLPDRELFGMSNHSSLYYYGMTWSPDGSMTAHMPRAGNLQIYDIVNDEEKVLILENMPDEAKLGPVAWSPNGLKIAIGGQDGYCRLYNRRGEYLLSIPHEEEAIMTVKWSDDSQYLATSTWDGRLCVWDGNSGSLMTTLKRHNERVRYLEWSRDGQSLISLSMDGDLKIHDLTTAQPALEMSLGTTISCFSWNRDQDRIIYATFQAMNLTMINMEGLPLWVKPFDNWIHEASWSPDGNQIMIVVSYSPIQVLSKHGKVLCNLTGITDPFGADEAKWSPDSKYIAAMGNNGLLYFYDATQVTRLPEHEEAAIVSILILLILGLGSRDSINERIRFGRSTHDPAK
jgi:WD40 repeat protein